MHNPREYPKSMKPERQMEGAMDCTICDITLNSATTYKMHIEGTKHLKKVRHEKKKKEELQKKKNKQVECLQSISNMCYCCTHCMPWLYYVS